MTPTIYFFGLTDKVMIAKTFFNEICGNKQVQVDNEMFGFEMAKCVLIQKIKREVTGNAVCTLEELYIHGHCAKARK